jgi:hypothetical protein
MLTSCTEWIDKHSPEVKMVGLISVDILIEEGRATKCGAYKVTELFVGTSERPLRKWRGEFYKKGEIRQMHLHQMKM